MSTTQPDLARHRAEFYGDQLTLHIPSRKPWAQIPFLLIWLMLWSFGWLTAVSTLIRMPIGTNLFMLTWLIFWTAGGFFAITTLLWLLFGEEVVEVSYELLCIKRQIFGIGKTKSFETIHVKDFRVSAHPAPATVWNNRRNNNMPSIWKMTGPITFDYGAKTYRFGDGVDEAEAKQIVKLMQKHYPKFA